MQVYEQERYNTYCCTPSDWADVKKKLGADKKVSVLDIRTVQEAADQKLEDVPESWNYRRWPVVAATVSEQDVDVFRREQRRHGELVVVATNEVRSGLLVLTDLSRINRTLLPEQEVKKLGDVKKEQGLVDWLNQYLERHKTTDSIGEY